MDAKEPTINNDKSNSITKPTVTKSPSCNAERRFWRSNIPASELSETLCPICGDQRRKFMCEEREYPIWKCKQCGHIYVSPRPSEAVLADYYTTDFMPHTEDENIYEGKNYGIYDAAARAIVKFMPHRGDLLDVGAGFGGFLERASKDGWRLSGIELSESALAVCQRRLGSKAHLSQASFEQVKIAPCSFDCVVMLNVIEHVRDPLKVCRRAFEILRPGGCLALRWPQHIFNQYLAPPDHLHAFTRRSIEKLLCSGGFACTREFWAGTKDYRDCGLTKYVQAIVLRAAARVLLSCTLGRRQIPFVSRLTLGRKPRQA